MIAAADRLFEQAETLRAQAAWFKEHAPTQPTAMRETYQREAWTHEVVAYTLLLVAEALGADEEDDA